MKFLRCIAESLFPLALCNFDLLYERFVWTPFRAFQSPKLGKTAAAVGVGFGMLAAPSVVGQELFDPSLFDPAGVLFANDDDSVLVARFPAAVHSTLNAFHTMWSDALCFGYLGGQTNLFDCPAEKRIPRLVAQEVLPSGLWN